MQKNPEIYEKMTKNAEKYEKKTKMIEIAMNLVYIWYNVRQTVLRVIASMIKHRW